MVKGDYPSGVIKSLSYLNSGYHGYTIILIIIVSSWTLKGYSGSGSVGSKTWSSNVKEI